MDEIRVVVVIPYYNGSAFIERSARSVLEQTVPPFEFLIVDDGSSAEEAARLDAIANQLGINVIHKQNGGQGSARNAGVAASKAEYICFLDQDDFYLKNHIEILIDAMPENEPHFGWVYGELFEAEGNGEIVRTSIVTQHAKHPKTNIHDILVSDMFVLPSASLISRLAFETVGGFDEQFMGYEDDDLFLRLFRAGFTNHFTEKAVTVWCIHTESTSYGIRMARSRLRYFKKLAAAFPNDPIKERFYMRDVLIPRFNHQIISEAIAAASGRKGKFFTHRDEYIAIAREYTEIVQAAPNVPQLFKIRAKLRMHILGSTRWRALYRLHPALNRVRRMGKLFR
ncbi:glycosyltransferase family 2 protein [Methylobacterium sp. Leaf106]|uniref:glycosyltransferase family 2 protein n=1 Tax=Methylobacterium sp. Leaf106 TaxID=1736255 RepID=UPI001FCD6DB3|nr:glycosyltransferase family A protein [Methylobacterium sp. Leaf106]